MSNILLSFITKCYTESAAELYNKGCPFCLEANQKGFFLRENGIFPVILTAEKNADVAEGAGYRIRISVQVKDTIVQQKLTMWFLVLVR